MYVLNLLWRTAKCSSSKEDLSSHFYSGCELRIHINEALYLDTSLQWIIIWEYILMRLCDYNLPYVDGNGAKSRNVLQILSLDTFELFF